MPRSPRRSSSPDRTRRSPPRAKRRDLREGVRGVAADRAEPPRDGAAHAWRVGDRSWRVAHPEPSASRALSPTRACSSSTAWWSARTSAARRCLCSSRTPSRRHHHRLRYLGRVRPFLRRCGEHHHQVSGNEMHDRSAPSSTTRSGGGDPKTTPRVDGRPTSATRRPSAGWLMKDRSGTSSPAVTSASNRPRRRSPFRVGRRPPFVTGTDQQRYEGKLTVAPFQGHRLVGSYIRIDEDEAGNRFGNVLDTRSLHDRSLPQQLMRRQLHRCHHRQLLHRGPVLEARADLRELRLQVHRPHQRHADGHGQHRLPVVEPGLLRRLPPGRAQQREHHPQGLLVPLLREHRIPRPVVRLRHVRRPAASPTTTSRAATSGSSPQPPSCAATTSTPVLRTDPNGALSQYIQFNPILQDATSDVLRHQLLFLNDKWRLNDNWASTSACATTRTTVRMPVGKVADGQQGEPAPVGGVGTSRAMATGCSTRATANTWRRSPTTRPTLPPPW